MNADCDRKIIFYLTLVAALLVILFFFVHPTNALEIDACTTWPQFSPTNFTVFNSTTNTTQNVTAYLPSSAIEICPKVTSVSFLNLTWGQAINGTTGTCAYNISVQNSSQLFPKRRYVATIGNGGIYVQNDSFVEIDVRADALFCAVCPVQKICNMTYAFPGIYNETQRLFKQDEACDIDVSVPARPYCLSDDSGWLMNYSVLGKEYLGKLIDDSRGYYNCNASLQVYQQTWFAPEEHCNIAPDVLLSAFDAMGGWERDKAKVFAELRGGTNAEGFASAINPSPKTEQEANYNRQMAYATLETYVRLGLADWQKDTYIDGFNHTQSRIYGYKPLISPSCLNMTSGLRLIKAESTRWGNFQVLIGSGVAIVLGIAAYWAWKELWGRLDG